MLNIHRYNTPFPTQCFFLISIFLWRTADTCVLSVLCKGTQVSAPRLLRSYACRLRCTIPLQSFCRCCFVPAVFFLSTDTDVGGSKQKRVLLSKICSQKPHDLTIVHGWTWFHTVTSLTFRQTRVQALYMDVQRLIEDFRFNRCPESFPIPVYSSHTAVTRSVRKRMLFFIC